MNVQRGFLLLMVLVGVLKEYEAAGPIFLQAIATALSTIPFTGGPLTTGLVGAKLAIGTKLLYFLGKFGRKSKAKPAASKAASKPASKGVKAPLGGMQAVPLPYAMMGGGGFGGAGFPKGGGFGGAGFPQGGGFGGAGFPQGGGFGGSGFPQGGGFGGAGFSQGGGFGGFPQGGFGGFQQMGGFGGSNFQGGNPVGADSSQMFQAMLAQGYDANEAMQALNYGQFPNNQFPSGQFPSGGFPQGSQMNAAPSGTTQGGTSGDLSSDSDSPSSSSSEPSEDVESFFTFLQDMDENTCISRLICDIGAEPSFLGDFSENIHGIVGSLTVSPASGAYKYVQIMEGGNRDHGGCAAKFPGCSDGEYEIVKSVAPSVSLPQNVDASSINQL